MQVLCNQVRGVHGPVAYDYLDKEAAACSLLIKAASKNASYSEEMSGEIDFQLKDPSIEVRQARQDYLL